MKFFNNTKNTQKKNCLIFLLMEITYENTLRLATHSKSPPLYDILIKLKKPSDFKLPSESPQIQCILYKKQKILKNKKPGLYHFYDDKCLYFQIARRNLLKGVIFFENVTQLEPIKGANPKTNEKKPLSTNEFLGFRLHKHANLKEFFSPDGKTLENVIKFLGKRIFQRNFHQNYKALKQLGRGNFATVTDFFIFPSFLRNFLGFLGLQIRKHRHQGKVRNKGVFQGESGQ